MAAVVGTQNASAFAATLSTILSAPLSRVESDRSLEIARAVVGRGGDMGLTAPEALLVSRHLLYSLKLTVK